MVKDGKRMWKEMVNANWMRDRRRGSSSGILGSQFGSLEETFSDSGFGVERVASRGEKT
jgi:hypothetical protein